IKLPAQPKVGLEFGCDQPSVLRKGEELPRPVIREERGQVASRLAWYVQQKAGEIVCKTCFAGAAASVERSLTVTERIDAPRAEGLFLEQGIANTPQVATKLNGVIAENLGPRIRKIDVRFRADPWQARREAKQRRIAVK